MQDERTDIFQIWIIPAERGGDPKWASAEFPKGDRAGKLVPLASGRHGANDHGALEIRQDAAILGATLEPGQETRYDVPEGRFVYLVAASGTVEVNGVKVNARDGVAITNEANVVLKAANDAAMPAELLLADVPA